MIVKIYFSEVFMIIKMNLMSYRHKPYRILKWNLLFVAILLTVGAGRTMAQNNNSFQLKSAQMCEGINEKGPQNPAVVFSVTIGKVYCYSSFSNIVKDTTIYHYWYSRDHLTAKVKLAIQSPTWSTYSNIQLRQSDKGPWRVEIVDINENVLQTLRFSVVE